MLDLIGTTVLTAAIAVNLNAAITMMPLSSARKLTTVAIAGLWIGLAIALATGMLDLVTAVSLGVASAPGSPLQIFGETIGSNAMWSLPWSNIPTLLVPFYLITHGIIFVKLARTSRVAMA